MYLHLVILSLFLKKKSSLLNQLSTVPAVHVRVIHKEEKASTYSEREMPPSFNKDVARRRNFSFKFIEGGRSDLVKIKKKKSCGRRP